MAPLHRICRFLIFVCAILLVVAPGGVDAVVEDGAIDAEAAAGQATCADQECANPDAGAAPASQSEDPKCPSRQHVTRCAGQYLDANQNGKLERAELQSAIDSLPWYGRGILNILGSVDKMMAKCDVDKDDAISMGYDMIHNAETCLATCFKRMAFKKAFFPDCKL